MNTVVHAVDRNLIDPDAFTELMREERFPCFRLLGVSPGGYLVRIGFGAGIGVVVTDQDTGDATEVLRDAHPATYEVERRGGSRLWVHDPRGDR